VAASESAWQGGWFHTGDVVRQGSDGSLHFVDRQNNVIRRSGENIAALEVEGVILELDWVAQVAVIAAPDALRGEEVMACVVTRNGAARDAASARQVSAWCLEHLSYYKAPGWVAFRDRLPTTTTQKIKKAELRPLASDPAALTDCFDMRDRKRP
jgi:acyl-coenzyme A synthetase/AMP-(fatty) acid ligase